MDLYLVRLALNTLTFSVHISIAKQFCIYETLWLIARIIPLERLQNGLLKSTVVLHNVLTINLSTLYLFLLKTTLKI